MTTAERLLEEAVEEIKERHSDRALAPGLECQCKFCTGSYKLDLTASRLPEDEPGK